MAVNLELLTDEDIIDYTRDSEHGKDRVITNHGDLNLRCNYISPIPGGVSDVEIFGSPMEDRCICGYLRQPSSEPCPNCGARVYTREEGLRRFARIELPFYYLNDLRFDIFKNLFDDIFAGVKIEYDFFGSDLKRNGYSASKSGKKPGIKVFDTCQFNYDPKKKVLTISEFITDMEKCSYEGLIKIIKEHFPDRLTEFMKLINRYYLVMPAMMRPFTLGRKGSQKKMGSHKLSVWYSIIVRLCCVEDEPTTENYANVMSKLSTPGEKVRYTALLRAFLNTGKKEATRLLNTTKENLARDLYAVRTKNSARSPIIPSVDLPIDCLGVPKHLAYELMREGFMKYLQDELNFTYKEARNATKVEAFNEETQKLFKEYAEKQVVLKILVRQVF